MSFLDTIGNALGFSGDSAQDQYIQQLQAQISGNGPSPAQALLQMQTNQNQQNVAGAVGNVRGLSPALAARQILEQQGQIQQQATGQAALARDQEQLGAEGLLGGAVNAQRSQDQAGTQMLGGALNGVAGGVTSLASLGSKVAPLAAVALADGGQVPGQAKQPGVNTPSNDTVPARLTPGEDVLPLSVTQAPDAPARAAAFVAAIQQKNAGAGPSGYARVLDAHRRFGGAR